MTNCTREGLHFHFCIRCLDLVDCESYFANDHVCDSCALKANEPHPLRTTSGGFFPDQERAA